MTAAGVVCVIAFLLGCVIGWVVRDECDKGSQDD